MNICKTITLFLGLIFFSINTINAQLYWLSPEIINDDVIALTDLEGNQYIKQPINKSINFNPVIDFTDNKIELNLDENTLSKSTIFTLFQKSYSSKEEHIWNVSNGDSDNIILTSERLADRKKGTFINFINEGNNTHINVFQQNIGKYHSTSFQIGGNANNRTIPINNFAGELAEIIVFNKYLNPLARQILESSLALKYSVPLQAGIDYLGKEGKVLWSFEKHDIFRHNLAGIGKNLSLNLNQKQSKSRINDGFLSVGLGEITQYNFQNTSSWPDESYLLWADNGGDITFITENNGVSFLDRTWKFQSSSFDISQPLQCILKEKNIIHEKEDNMHFWLLWNNSPEPLFSSNSSQIDRARIQDQYIKVDSFYHNPDLPYLHVFQAPNFWAALDIDEPDCSLQKTGAIHGIVLGPEPPYNITLRSSENDISVISDTRKFTVPSLESNEYEIIITTLNGNYWRTKIILEDKGIFESPLLPSYLLDEDESLIVDASFNSQVNFEYVWTLPDGLSHYDPQITLDSPGEYSLIIKNGECQSFFKTVVYHTVNNIQECYLFPNPTTTGRFVLKARLKNPTPYVIQITSFTGEILSKEQFTASKDIAYYGEITRDGSYILTLISGKSRNNSTLLVIQN